MNARKAYLFLLSVSVLLSAYLIATAIHTRQTTGLLVVKSSENNATITLSQPNRKMLNIGTGNARIHLPPGSYQLLASSGKTQVTKTIQIDKKQLLAVNLQLVSSAQNKLNQDNTEANTLIKLLPYAGPANEYIVSYSYKFESNIAQPTINITAATTQAQQDALNWIKNLGFNTSKLDIKYNSSRGE